MRRLALCVDDLGLHDGINRAASHLAEAGRLNGVGCMVGAPAWRAAAIEVPALRRAGIDIGLHLDFTDYPLTAAGRAPLAGLMARAYAGRLDADRLAAEIEAQFDAFEAATGAPPDYVDGHRHVHQLPMIREALARVLRQRGAPVRPWLRCTRRPAGVGAAWKPWLIEALGAAALTGVAKTLGCPQNAHLLGVHDFTGDAAGYRRRLAAWLAVAGDGDVLMCHPSRACAADDPLLPARLCEYAELGGPAFGDALSRAGLTLAPFSATVSRPWCR